jgi:hypothetical protein
LLSPKNKISCVELSGLDTPAVIAAQSLQIAGGAHYCPAMSLLKEVDIIKTFFRVLVIAIGRYPRGSTFKLCGQHGFGPVNK